MAAGEPSETQNVYIVEIALARSDGSQARDAKLIVASSPADAESLALESVDRRWPGHRALHVVSIRVDHSERARRYFLSLLDDN